VDFADNCFGFEKLAVPAGRLISELPVLFLIVTSFLKERERNFCKIKTNGKSLEKLTLSDIESKPFYRKSSFLFYCRVSVLRSEIPAAVMTDTVQIPQNEMQLLVRN
jgi:hypothetical protein